MKKGDVGMAKRFSKKVRKQVMSYQLRAIRKLCQDSCQRLMLHPSSLPPEAVMRDVASGADRNLGITFGLHVVDSSRTMVDILLC